MAAAKESGRRPQEVMSLDALTIGELVDVLRSMEPAEA